MDMIYVSLRLCCDGCEMHLLCEDYSDEMIFAVAQMIQHGQRHKRTIWNGRLNRRRLNAWCSLRRCVCLCFDWLLLFWWLMCYLPVPAFLAFQAQASTSPITPFLTVMRSLRYPPMTKSPQLLIATICISSSWCSGTFVNSFRSRSHQRQHRTSAMVMHRRSIHLPPRNSRPVASALSASVTGSIYDTDGAPTVKLFTKEGCTLCDKVKDVRFCMRSLLIHYSTPPISSIFTTEFPFD